MLKDEQMAGREWMPGLRFYNASLSRGACSSGLPEEHRCQSKGFSLVELTVVVSITAILLATAVPAFTGLMARNELVVATNAARGALMLARETAVLKGQPVSLCAGTPTSGCSGDWSGGQWLVFRDSNHSGDLDAGETVLEHGAVPGTAQGVVTIGGNGPLRSALVYMPLGHAERVSGAFAAGRLRLCVAKDVAPNARELVISASGRVRLARVDFGGTCPSL
ncbi:GspH/FimT family pseudopilin [Marinobacter xestospongiae]|uniref:Type II secretion system protein H n=1 Tax=Marinobacter xestospongiae TaxID=994319 RepID=A0ABU3W3H6_9GAMM|nr:GspH/FimT family pseudopilin [Marinobacter xestospongiae]MDV2080900.1 GspH/FimT family pseudopilin [Marinobacter xestospongiae]